jgi:hypothetical protein
MSYPAAPGYGSNLGCETGLQRSAAQFNFVLDTGAAAGGGSNLTSPVTLTPGPYSITGGTTLTLGQGADNALAYDPATHITTVGDGNPAGKVVVDGTFQVFNPAIVGANAVQVEVTAPTTSTIGQLAATTGTLQIGSSASNPNTLEVADIAGNGGVYIRSTAADLPLVLSSTTASGSSVVNGVPSAGRLTLGSSAANPSAILIVDSVTSVTNLGLDTTPQVLLARGTYTAGSNTIFAGPVGVGLYAILGCSSPPGNTGTTIGSQLSTFAYVNVSGGIQMGGAAYSQNGTTEYVAITPDPTNVQNLSLQITAGSQSLVGFSVVAVRISTGIAGMF